MFVFRRHDDLEQELADLNKQHSYLVAAHESAVNERDATRAEVRVDIQKSGNAKISQHCALYRIKLHRLDTSVDIMRVYTHYSYIYIYPFIVQLPVLPKYLNYFRGAPFL